METLEKQKIDFREIFVQSREVDFYSRLNGNDFTSFAETVTPELAKMLLEYRYKNQRHLRQDHVNLLAGLMRRGNWRPGSVINFTIQPNGSIDLVNGQHTLNAIVQSGITIPLTIILSAVNTDEDVAMTYSSIDTNIGIRNGSDAISAYEVQKITGLNKTNLTKTVSATRLIYLAFAINNIRKSEMSMYLQFPPNLAPIVIDWAPYATKYFDCIKDGNQEITELMRKSSIAGMGMITFRYAPIISSEFWHQVSHDDALAKDDPRKTLSRFILTNPAKSLGQSSLKHPDYAHAVERCWRAYVDGERLTKVYLPKMNEAMSIGRTPYNTQLDDLGIGYPKDFRVS